MHNQYRDRGFQRNSAEHATTCAYCGRSTVTEKSIACVTVIRCPQCGISAYGIGADQAMIEYAKMVEVMRKSDEARKYIDH